MELDLALVQMKARNAEGPDQIPPRLLKGLGPIAKDFLLACFNQSFETGFCPQEWRQTIIVPIPKSGKVPTELESYRPISLTLCIAKLMERLVTNRLCHLAESQNWLCADQSGFRRLRGTEDQLIRLTQSISDGFQANPALRTILALLDFSKAYDRV